jgi:TonB family protein
MGVKVLGFAHNLNFSLNKKRMEMMKKEKSPWASKMKLLLALPIIALLVFAFAKKEYVMTEAENTSINVQSEIDEGIITNDLITVKGKVTDSEGNPMTGANVVLKGTTNGTVVDRQGEFQLETPKKFTLVVSYVGYETVQGTFSSENKESLEVMMNLKKGVFNIKLPDVNDPNFKMQLPPPPPPKDYKKVDKEILYEVVEQMPYYQNGGMSRLALELKKQIDWVLDKTNDRGEALVGFTVGADGKIINPHITKSAGSKRLDESAVKIINKLDNWSPARQRGKKVPVDLTVPVNFN